jgi:hypothetical protein
MDLSTLRKQSDCETFEPRPDTVAAQYVPLSHQKPLRASLSPQWGEGRGEG